MPKTLKIAFDFDGTIADTNAVKSAWIKQHVGIDVPQWKCERTNCVPIIGAENYAMMAKFAYGDEGTRATKPIPGAIQGIKTIATKATLYILTKRRAHNKVFVENWLKTYGIADCFEEVLLSTNRSKIQFCFERGISILLDNNAKNLTGTKKRNMSVLLFKPTEDDNSFSDHIIRVNNWQEVIAHAMRFEAKNIQQVGETKIFGAN